MTNSPQVQAERWLTDFASALEEGDEGRVAALFVADAEWRDIVAVTWDFASISGAETVAARLVAAQPQVRLSGFALAENRREPGLVPRLGEEVIEAIYRFDTAVGEGAGVLRLVPGADGVAKACLLSTTLQSIRGHEEQMGELRPSGLDYSTGFGSRNWQDARLEEIAFADREPDVLVIGGGQAGLTAAARLRVMGVDSLVVEKLPKVGDVWRRRYHTLTLHNQTWAGSFPYLDFPETWPTFLPKDKLAGWMEYYAEAMELNVWTGTTVMGGTWDEVEGRWEIALLTEGAERVVRPRHLIYATGSVSGLPYMPKAPGIDQFGGEVLHSSQYASGSDYGGKRALVIGTGASGHDVAQDLHALGSDVTLVQRGSTAVVSNVPSGVLPHAIFSAGYSLEDADLIVASSTYNLVVRSSQLITEQTQEWDADLLARLAAVGFKTDIGEDGTGFVLKYNRRGGGYYINVGCSELIADREIALLQNDEIETFTPAGVLLRNGEEIALDLVVFATGYSDQQEQVRRLFGDEVADRVGPIWGVGDDGEMRGVWRPTGQRGLWFHGGGLTQCRANSKFLALQIIADLEGVNPRARAIAGEAEPALASHES